MAIALLCATLGAAQAAPARANNVEQARTEFKKAVKSYDLAQFSEALASYSEAYRLDPKPQTLFNIAQCHRQLAEFQKASFFYRRYLAQFPSKAPNEALVRELLAESDAKADREALAAPPPGEDTPVVPVLPASLGGPAELLSSPPPMVEASVKPPLVKRWWFWAGIGVVVAGATTAYLATSPQPQPTSLGTQDLR